MMPPVLGLKITPPTRRYRRIGACAAALVATTLTLPAAVDVAPVGAQEAPPEDIADRLIPSVAGYVVAPEGSGAGNSREVTLEDLAVIAGTELPELAGRPTAGYMRIFAAPAGDGVAVALGFDLGAGDAAEFVAGFREAGAEQARAVPLFPDAASPLGDVVAYEADDPASSRQMLLTAFASDSLVVVLVAGDPDDSVAVLRQMAQDQVALTPPTAADPEDGETAAYTLGRILGSVAILLVGLGVPAWLIVRAVRRRNPPAPVVPDPTASPGSRPYPARRPGIPLPPLEPSSAAPPPPPRSPGDYPPRRPGIPLPPLETGSEG